MESQTASKEAVEALKERLIGHEDAGKAENKDMWSAISSLRDADTSLGDKIGEVERVALKSLPLWITIGFGLATGLIVQLANMALR